MKTEEEIRKGLKQLENVFAQTKQSHSIAININAYLGLPTTENPLFTGGVKLNVNDLIEDLECIIRATEICTLNWVLEQGGGLNTKKWVLKSPKEETFVGHQEVGVPAEGQE